MENSLNQACAYINIQLSLMMQNLRQAREVELYLNRLVDSLKMELVQIDFKEVRRNIPRIRIYNMSQKSLVRKNTLPTIFEDNVEELC